MMSQEPTGDLASRDRTSCLTLSLKQTEATPSCEEIIGAWEPRPSHGPGTGSPQPGWMHPQAAAESPGVPPL